VHYIQRVAFASCCSGRRDHDSRVSIIVNLLQESIFEEIITESLPQLAIQALNQTLNKEWTNLGYVSIIMYAACFVLAHCEKRARTSHMLIARITFLHCVLGRH
jgi:hypothetical protein